MSKPINIVDVAREGIERDDDCRISFHVAVREDPKSGQCLVRVNMRREGEQMLTMYFQAENAAEADKFAEQTRPMFRNLIAVHVPTGDGDDLCL